MKLNYVIIIAGPTAVGKTALSLQIAQRFNTAIISADSRQCFRELNIGVAKPEPAELALVPHYFINSHSIQEEVNAAVFEQYALNAAASVFTHSNVAVMCGGTGLYIKAFCEGLDNIPDVPEAIHQQVLNFYQTNGLEGLQQELQAKDPVFWETAEQQNPQRLMRALEVFDATGQSINSFRSGKKENRPFRTIKIGLELDRPLLYERINRRVDIMMEQGLLKEVTSLLPHKNLNAFQTVGYREFFDYLDGKTDLPRAVELLKQNTRHYAKRQLTWFKRDEEMRWFHPADGEGAAAYITKILAEG